MQPMRELSGLDDDGIRREVIASARPAVLRGFVDHWPLVAAARQSPHAVAGILRRHDNGTPVDAILLPPECGGRIGYDPTMSGFNFVRNRLPVTAVAEQVLRYSQFPKAPAVAAQSALIPRRRIWMNGTTSAAWLPAAGASRCSRPSRSPISTSARSTSHRPALR
jgi:hypothetical protein